MKHPEPVAVGRIKASADTCSECGTFFRRAAADALSPIPNRGFLRDVSERIVLPSRCPCGGTVLVTHAYTTGAFVLESESLVGHYSAVGVLLDRAPVLARLRTNAGVREVYFGRSRGCEVRGPLSAVLAEGEGALLRATLQGERHLYLPSASEVVPNVGRSVVLVTP